MADLTEQIIATSIWLKWGRQSIAAPNIKLYPFESDLLILRESGYVSEYEIKLTARDFRADNRKSCRMRAGSTRLGTYERELYRTVNRYEWLQAGYGPNRFYYAVPEKLIGQVEIPEWAGIISCWPTRTQGRCGVSVQRHPKLLHRLKVDDTVKEKILRSTYYRYWHNYAHTDTYQKRSEL